MKISKSVTRATVGAALAIGLIGLGAPANAEGDCSTGAVNCFHSQEVLFVSYTGHVQIRASYYDNSRHALRAYQRFIRSAGPSLDTGRMYTSSASSNQDSTLRQRDDLVWDSPFWGDQYTTHYYYGFEWF